MLVGRKRIDYAKMWDDKLDLIKKAQAKTRKTYEGDAEF